MSKRSAGQDASPPPKRQRPNGVLSESPEEVHSARQLQQLLSFQQNSLPGLNHGIRSFKLFLDSILYPSDKASSTKSQQDILKTYLDSQKSKPDPENETPFLGRLMQAWSFATQAEDRPNHSLQSAIPSVLAALLKTMSTLIDFRDHGLELCRTVLQTPQLKLISNGLSAHKNKAHIISPCLRLLKETVAFDGGTLAIKVFAAKTFIYDGKIVARNLTLWSNTSEDAVEIMRKPSVRTNAVRYVLAILKFMSGPAKAEILRDDNVVHALFQHLQRDPLDVLEEILATVKTHVLLDHPIPTSVKSHILNEQNLSNVARICRGDTAEQDEEMQGSPRSKLLQSFLLFVCSDPRVGVLRPLAGWFPPGTDRDATGDEQENETAEIDLGLDSVEWYDRYQDDVPIRNATLSRFAQTLRPHANVLEAEVLIKIFQSAPELVADYFFKKSNFPFDPKLTATWIGYSAFLFSTVQLPVPLNFGRKDGIGRIPPPASIVIESILPRPLTLKVLTRCLNQQVELITFFAVRLLCVAFQKLRAVLTQFREVARSEGSLWDEGAARVADEFMKRCPKMKDVIGTLRNTKSDNLLQREAVLRLLSLYYEVTPQAALEEKFDGSTMLADALKLSELGEDVPSVILTKETPSETDQPKLQLLILNHLLKIAHRTPGMRWWQKPESLKLSPFMTLLKIAVKMSSQNIPEDMYSLLDSIIRENGILQQETEIPALHALIASLSPREDFIPSKVLDEFVDDAIARVVRKPIKYEGDFDQLATGLEESDRIGPVSLFAMTLAEQWPFAAERDDPSNSIPTWIGRYLSSSIQIGEDDKIINKILKGMTEVTNLAKVNQCLKGHTPEELSQGISNLHFPERSGVNRTEGVGEKTKAPARPLIDFEAFSPPTEDPKHRGLHRWSTKDIPTAVAEGDLAALILCLSSAFPEVRQLALANLRQFSKNLDAVKSSYADAQQVYLLTGLLINTVTPLIHPPASARQTNGIANTADDDTDKDSPGDGQGKPAVPYFCTVYAVLALHILQDPLHPLYAKINDFHTRSPKWDIERLPSYWTHQILFTRPTPSYSITPASNSNSNSTSSSALTTQSTRNQTQSHSAALSNPPLLTALTLTSPSSMKTALQTPQHFLLTYIHASLRTPSDLSILRKRGTLEPLFALANNPFLERDSLEALLCVVARLTGVPGGSDVLITRKGGVAWLGALLRMRAEEDDEEDDNEEAEAEEETAGEKGEGGGGDRAPRCDALSSRRGLAQLLRRVWETCDRDYVDRWSAGRVGALIDELTREVDGLV